LTESGRVHFALLAGTLGQISRTFKIA